MVSDTTIGAGAAINLAFLFGPVYGFVAGIVQGVLLGRRFVHRGFWGLWLLASLGAGIASSYLLKVSGALALVHIGAGGPDPSPARVTPFASAVIAGATLGGMSGVAQSLTLLRRSTRTLWWPLGSLFAWILGFLSIEASWASGSFYGLLGFPLLPGAIQGVLLLWIVHGKRFMQRST